jgi:hypothetical protein
LDHCGSGFDYDLSIISKYIDLTKVKKLNTSESALLGDIPAIENLSELTVNHDRLDTTFLSMISFPLPALKRIGSFRIT